MNLDLLPEFLRRFAPPAADAPGPRTLEIPGTPLRLREIGPGRLELQMAGLEASLGTLRGRWEGAPVRVEGPDPARVRVRLAIRAPEGTLSFLSAHADGHAPAGGGLRLLRSSRFREPGGPWLLEIAVGGSGPGEGRYLLEMDPALELEGFPEVEDRRPVFATVPPVPQMGALLRLALADPAAREGADLVVEVARRSNSRRLDDLQAWLAGGAPWEQASYEVLREWLGPLAPSSEVLGPALLFADAEAGLLAGPPGAPPPPSPYAVLAVASALDDRARLLELPPGTPLDQVAPGDRMWSSADGEHWTREPEPASRYVLLRLPLIDQRAASDLDTLLALGQPVLAHFTSDLDHSVVWSRVDPDGPRHFAEGLATFHFSGRVAGFLEPLALPSEGACVTVLRDNRGNLHLRALPPGTTREQAIEETGSDLEWLDQGVRLPSLEGLPRQIREPGRNRLLGRAPVLSEEMQALEDLPAALEVLEGGPEGWTRCEEAGLLRDAAPFLAGSGRVSLEIRSSLVGLPEPTLALLAACRARLDRGATAEAPGSPRRELLLRCLQGLQSPSPEDRARSLALALFEEVAGKGLEALSMDLEAIRLERGTRPAVLALAVLLRAALPGEFPAPAAVRFVAAETAGDEAAARLLRDLEAWVREDSLRALRLPFTDVHGRLVPESAEPLVRRVLAVNRAWAASGRMDTVRHSCLLDDDRLAALRTPLVESWRLFCTSVGDRLHPLLQRWGPARLYREYLAFVLWTGAEDLEDAGIAPSLGGPVRMFRFEPGQALGVGSPMFGDLVEAMRRGRLDSLRLCLATRAGGVPLEQALTDPVSVLDLPLDPGSLEFFLPERERFVPFLRDAEWLRNQDPRDEEDQADLCALLHLYYGVRAEHDTVLGAALRVHPPASGSRPVREAADLDSLARRIAAVLGVSPAHAGRIRSLLLRGACLSPDGRQNGALTVEGRPERKCSPS